MEIESTLEQDISEGQLEYEKIKDIVELVKIDKAPGFHMDEQGIVWFKKRICVLDLKAIRELILRRAHVLAYSIHLGSTMMYQDLKEQHWWYGMNRDVAKYVALCDTCQ